MDHARRRFIAMASLLPLAAVASRAAGAKPRPAPPRPVVPATTPSPAATPAAATSCYDPAALSLSQKSRRRSLAYTEPSNDPARHCGGCAFFVAAAGAPSANGCGTCQLLGNAPVKAEAVCASYAPKPAANR